MADSYAEKNIGSVKVRGMGLNISTQIFTVSPLAVFVDVGGPRDGDNGCLQGPAAGTVGTGLIFVALLGEGQRSEDLAPIIGRGELACRLR